MDPRIDLTGQTALVTSASCGIGLAIVRALLACGAEIVGIGTRISQAAADPASDIAALGPGNTPMDADLSDRSQIAALVKMLEDQGRAVDILADNAGIIRRAKPEQHSDADWDAVMAVNVDAAFLLSRGLDCGMLERGGGKIVNVASILSYQGGIRVPGYAAGKGAIVQLTKAFANEWAARSVNVNAVAPGQVATDNTAAPQADAARSADLIARIPTGRSGTAEDIAWPVVFLFSDLALFIHPKFSSWSLIPANLGQCFHAISAR